MSQTATSPFQRQILDSDRQSKTTDLLQTNLVNLVDLALLLKPTHWNVIGANFRSIHLQLDEIIVTVRNASDEIAERIAALGVAADGRAGTVSNESDLSQYPDGFLDVASTVSAVADAMKTTIDALRDSISQLGDLDPISEDLCIGVSAELEKHLWMVQAQQT